MLRRVALKRADISEKRRVLQESHGVTSQKKLFFIVTAVKTSNLTWSCLLTFYKTRLQIVTVLAEYEGFWRSCITLRIFGIHGLSQRPEFQVTRKQRFGNWIRFRLHVSRGRHLLLGPLATPSLNKWRRKQIQFPKLHMLQSCKITIKKVNKHNYSQHWGQIRKYVYVCIL
jgi:hypothetical protein